MCVVGLYPGLASALVVGAEVVTEQRRVQLATADVHVVNGPVSLALAAVSRLLPAQAYASLLRLGGQLQHDVATTRRATPYPCM